MLLGQIEVTNFKSYRGTHTVGPLDRFSCIVGPNGSGKSNTLDALSFVLNVPNSSLRVKHLKNLIESNSSEARVRAIVNGRVFERRLARTAGEKNANESGLIGGDLNQDYSQVTSSQYYVDEKRVSQKQYNTELEGLNILSKVKNFVVFQGDIIRTDIDLLKMIENVCGSDAYIDEYETFSERIGILSRDLSLKYERRKDCLEMLVEMKGVREKERNFEALVTKKDMLQRRLYEMEIRNKKAEAGRIQAALQKLEETTEEEKYNEVLQRVNRLRSEAARRQKEYFERETELLFAKSKQDRRPAVDLEARRAELKKQQEMLGRTKEEHSRIAQPQKHTGKMGRDEVERVLAEKEKEYAERTQEVEKRLAEVTLQNFDKINRRDQIRDRLRQREARATKIRARNMEIERENRHKQERQAQIEREVRSLEMQIQDKGAAYERIVSDEKKLEKELNETMREILLNKAKKNDTARRSMVKSVVDNLKTIFAGVHGRVVELIEPTQKKYEMGVGVLLASHDQSVVVDTEKTALDCVRYLKDTKSCKLTFLPLDKMGQGTADDEQENVGNTETASFHDLRGHLARNCITFPSEYENVVYFLFRNSLVVDTVERAKHVVYHRKYPGKVCTEDGMLFTPNGLITGGRATVNKFEENIVEHLLTKRKAILNDMQMNRNRKDAFADVARVKQRIEELVQKKQEMRQEEPEAEEQQELETETLKQELEALGEELREFEDVQRTIREEKKRIEMDVYGPVLQEIGVRSVGEYREGRKQEYRRQELMVRMETIREKIALLNEEIAAEMAQEGDEKGTVNLEGAERELGRMYAELESHKERLRTESRVLKEWSEKRSQQNSLILKHRMHHARVEEELKDLVKYAELESNYQETAEDEAGLGVTELCLDDVAALRVQIDDLDRQIAQNVPTVAAEDASMQTRYAKLSREYEMAKEQLTGVKRQFQEVKRCRMDAFGQCFAQVSSKIAEIYQELTRSEAGEANAYLVYEGDPFANNVKYYLMPPAKRFVPFQELSGGERSMALLAFILALGAFRPPPFYVFDEVDSALDKGNVERLARYISESHEQFLVVSLKAQLFSRAESLFGVFKCPFDQTSKVLSLKLC